MRRDLSKRLGCFQVDGAGSGLRDNHGQGTRRRMECAAPQIGGPLPVEIRRSRTRGRSLASPALLIPVPPVCGVTLAYRSTHQAVGTCPARPSLIGPRSTLGSGIQPSNGLSCSPCDRLVRSRDGVPLRGSITEEERPELMSMQSTNPGEFVLTNVQGVNGIYGTSGGVSLRLPARASGSQRSAHRC